MVTIKKTGSHVNYRGAHSLRIAPEIKLAIERGEEVELPEALTNLIAPGCYEVIEKAESIFEEVESDEVEAEAEMETEEVEEIIPSKGKGKKRNKRNRH